ncbi:hypothetical protein PFNF54_00651, partial [Plasmodium falciparum NF54]
EYSKMLLFHMTRKKELLQCIIRKRYTKMINVSLICTNKKQ